MPVKPKKQTSGRFVEVSLQIAKEQFPKVSEALSAVMALAGLKPEKPSAAKTTKAKAAPASKTAKAKTAKGRPAGKPRTADGPKTPSSETASLLRDLRVKAGLSQKALAVKSGVSQNHISLLETGKQRLNPAMAQKLGRLLKATIPPS
jgi:ribosome-binding protein aMBF1 (putative translation factor)